MSGSGWPDSSNSKPGTRVRPRQRTVTMRSAREDLPKLAHELTFEVDDLLPLVDAAQVLGLAEVDDADLHVTEDGRTFVAADILESKQIFARRARERAPLVRAICNALET